jgi:adenosylhomocysteine nucleosidase
MSFKQQRLAIVAALHEELSEWLAQLPDRRCERVAGRDVWVATFRGQSIVVTLSGIGKVAAATTATLLIQRFDVQRIVFTGVAGGLGPGVAVGDVVVARRLLQHDMNAWPLVPRHEVPGYGRAHFEADKTLSDALAWACEQALLDMGLPTQRLHQGLIISGDQFVCDTAVAQALQRDLPDALAVEMEGAAFAQVCHDHGVPLAVVRTISDRADDDAHTDFSQFLRDFASPYSQALLNRWFT